MDPKRLAEIRERYSYFPEAPFYPPAIAGKLMVPGVTLTAEQYSHLRADLLEMLDALEEGG